MTENIPEEYDALLNSTPTMKTVSFQKQDGLISENYALIDKAYAPPLAIRAIRLIFGRPAGEPYPFVKVEQAQNLLRQNDDTLFPEIGALFSDAAMDRHMWNVNALPQAGEPSALYGFLRQIEQRLPTPAPSSEQDTKNTPPPLDIEIAKETLLPIRDKLSRLSSLRDFYEAHSDEFNRTNPDITNTRSLTLVEKLVGDIGLEN